MKNYIITNKYTGKDRLYCAENIGEILLQLGEVISYESEEFIDYNDGLLDKYKMIMHKYNSDNELFICPPNDEEFMCFMDDIMEMKERSFNEKKQQNCNNSIEDKIDDLEEKFKIKKSGWCYDDITEKNTLPY
jgi:hypothetical protein